MNIVSQLKKDGFKPQYVATTHGGEYASSCPWCGGVDRFRSWPARGPRGRWWCRQCGQRGDLVDYLLRNNRFEEIALLDAVDGEERVSADLETTEKVVERISSRRPEKVLQSPLWRKNALRLVSECQNVLEDNREALMWLQTERGLSPETVQRFRLGWNATNRWPSRELWGLEPELKPDGRPKSMWIPEGLVIPLVSDGEVLRLRVRRPDGEPRYCVVSGSRSMPMVVRNARSVTVVVESELDAMLIDQEAGDLVNAVALGFARGKPDAATDELLRTSETILVALDHDDAGALAWKWWEIIYPNARRWPPVDGKDPCEMMRAGTAVRDWILAWDDWGDGSAAA